MAYDGAGDVNVFLSPRVGFAGEPPTSHPHPPTSLLTFADMVIALDSRGTSSVQNLDHPQLDSKLKTDHTYASVANSRVMTRSQSLRTTQCPSPSSSVNLRHEIASTDENFETDNIAFSHSLEKYDTRARSNFSANLGRYENHVVSDDDQMIQLRTSRNKGRPQPQNTDQRLCHESEGDEEYERIIKRSSSFENVQNQTDIDITECSSEWPQISKKYTPRKSCSFEEVNHEINSQRRVVHRGGSSGQLHRLVNDTLEFPCWPRKADHTYATATWDGTAASHSLFEQEMCQETEATFTETTPAHHHDHQKMEVTETYILPVRTSDFESYSQQGTPTLLVQSLLDSSKCNQANQKDDHTYVKSNSNSASNCPSTSTDGVSVPNFSFATFPRQKTRDDHSGMIRRGNGVAGGKEWASSHSVSDLPMKKEQQASGTSSCNDTDFLQSVSTKKDHNYSTSS